MKKILIMYATAGIGHKKASLAVNAALEETKHEGAEVQIVDSLDYTSPRFKALYLQSYLLMVNKLPTFWGLSYYLTDNFFVNLLVSKVRRLNNSLNSAALVQFLAYDHPDVIISTHFFASEVIADLKKRGLCSAKLITVVTDYRLHSWWVAPGTDMYVVGSAEAKEDLLRWGVESDKVKVLGIPAEPAFSRKSTLDRRMLRQNTGLQKDVFTVLVIGGGFGVGPIVEIVKIIDEIPGATQTIVICGHNDNLVKQLEGMKPGLRKAIDVHGYVDNVHEYMDAADLLISKSGGITVTESLNKELPMVVISPIIGQETRNCDFLVANGAAIKADKLADLPGVLNDLVEHPEKIRLMREAISKIRKPTACYDIAKLGVEACRQGPSGT